MGLRPRLEVGEGFPVLLVQGALLRAVLEFHDVLGNATVLSLRAGH